MLAQVIRGESGERPPLLVLAHGGPTSNAVPELQMNVQFYTTRGFAVLDVDYRGSTLRGKRYRDALHLTYLLPSLYLLSLVPTFPLSLGPSFPLSYALSLICPSFSRRSSGRVFEEGGVDEGGGIPVICC